MTKERLVGNLLNLPISDFKELPEDENRINDHDGSVRYRMSRHHFQLQKDSNSIEGFFLAVKGPVLERAKFIKDIIDKLGDPLLIATYLKNPGVILITWDAKEVTKRLGN